MAMVRKFKTKSSSDEDLVAECKAETNYDARDISWTTPPVGTRIDPPADTVAIIIDVVSEKGRIRIYQKESDEQLDGVGIEWAGYKVMVPWDSTWWFRASGSLPVGYISNKEGAA